MTDLVLRTIGAGGKMGLKLAVVINDLARAMFDREDPCFEQYQYFEDGVLKTGRTFPAAWWPRLDKAIESGAIEHLSRDRIVEIMLQGPR